MYRVSPFTYVIEGIVGQAVGKQDVNCATLELVTLTPPSGQTCGEYMSNYINSVGGYLTNPNDSSACEFCPIGASDEFLANNFNIFYRHHWRNLGLLVAFIFFNVRPFLIFAFQLRLIRLRL